MSTKKGSYVIMMEQTKQPPKLIANVKPLNNSKFLIEIIHPNTRQTILSKTLECKDFNEAFDKANELKNSDEVLKSDQYQDPWYEETLFIPNPKKGKMKLKTKESAEDELNAALDELVDDDSAYDFSNADLDDLEDDEPMVKKAPKKAVKTKSKAKTPEKKAKKATKKAKVAPKSKKINKGKK